MEAATPLILILLAVVLFITTGVVAEQQDEREKKDRKTGANPQTPPSTSRIITFIVAGLLLVGGVGTLVYRRATGMGATGELNTWAEVLSGAVGPATAGVVGDMLKHGLWVALVIASVLALVFTVGIVPPKSPLAWIAYAAIGALCLVTLFTSPVISDMRGDGRLGRLFAWIRETVTTPKAIGFLVLAALAIGLVALGNIYPHVGWAVFAGIVILLGSYVYQNSEYWAPGLVEFLRNIRRTLAKWLGLGPARNPDLDFTKAEIDEMARGNIRRLVGSVAVLSAGLIALGVYLPTIWEKLPSLRIGGNIGTVLQDGAIPFATSKSFEIPGQPDEHNTYRLEQGGPGKPGALLRSTGTSEYTIGWWQFINSRNPTQAIPALELGPVGQMLIGPGPKTMTLALSSPAPLDAVYKLAVEIAPQKWQHVVLRASGNRTDVFLDGKLVGSSLHPPAAVRTGDILTMPGTPPQKTQGGITKLTYSPHAEPYTSIFLAAHSPPPETASA